MVTVARIIILGYAGLLVGNPKYDVDNILTLDYLFSFGCA